MAVGAAGTDKGGRDVRFIANSGGQKRTSNQVWATVHRARSRGVIRNCFKGGKISRTIYGTGEEGRNNRRERGQETDNGLREEGGAK